MLAEGLVREFLKKGNLHLTAKAMYVFARWRMAHARLGAMNSAENLLEGAREKKRAALWSVVSAVALVSRKLFLLGRAGGLGGLSEALHSSLGPIPAVITFLSGAFPDQPAHEQHPHG